jgi:hypothetical protein
VICTVQRARTIIIKGGYNQEECGDTYWLSEKGYHRDDEAGSYLTGFALSQPVHLSMTLASDDEKSSVVLPKRL